MKLDYELIKEILQKIEDNDGVKDNSITISERRVNIEKFQEAVKLAHHYEILIDDGLVYGKITELNSPDEIIRYIDVGELTMLGHRVIEGMGSETLWNKIKGGAKIVGIEGLKQIPALAIKILTTN